MTDPIDAGRHFLKMYIPVSILNNLALSLIKIFFHTILFITINQAFGLKYVFTLLKVVNYSLEILFPKKYALNSHFFKCYRIVF